MKITIPGDLDLELLIWRFYIDIFTDILMRYKRADFEDEDILNNPDVDYRKKMIVRVELGYKRIANEQIKLAQILTEILKGLHSKKYNNLSHAYRSFKTKKESEVNEFIINRYKLKKYLNLVFCANRIA